MTRELPSHLSVWPSALPCRPVVLSSPPVEARVADDTLIVGHGALFSDEANANDLLTTLPDSFYWRELSDLDLSSLDGLVAFARTYGVPFVPREGFLYELRAGAPQTFTLVVPAEEARNAVRLLRNMVRIWQVNVGALDLAEFREAWEPCEPHGTFPMDRIEEAPPDPYLQALSAMACVVDHGIKEFSPLMRLHPGQPVSTLFGATCAQLFNAVAENKVWHRCARCGKPFQRRWSTTSAQYCGDRCAKAAASKAYRDRKRHEGSVAPSGGVS